MSIGAVIVAFEVGSAQGKASVICRTSHSAVGCRVTSNHSSCREPGIAVAPTHSAEWPVRKGRFAYQYCFIPVLPQFLTNPGEFDILQFGLAGAVDPMRGNIGR